MSQLLYQFLIQQGGYLNCPIQEKAISDKSEKIGGKGKSGKPAFKMKVDDSVANITRSLIVGILCSIHMQRLQGTKTKIKKFYSRIP